MIWNPEINTATIISAFALILSLIISLVSAVCNAKKAKMEKARYERQLEEIEKQRQIDKERHGRELAQLERHHYSKVRPYFRILAEESALTKGNQGYLIFGIVVQNIGLGPAFNLGLKPCNISYPRLSFPILFEKSENGGKTKKIISTELYYPKIADVKGKERFNLHMILIEHNEVVWDYVEMINFKEHLSYQSINSPIEFTITFKDGFGNQYEQILYFGYDYGLFNTEPIIDVIMHGDDPQLINTISK